MKNWEDLITVEDRILGFDISVLPEGKDIVQVVQELMEKNELPRSVQLSVLGDKTIKTATINTEVIQICIADTVNFLNKIKSTETIKAVRCELYNGSAILIQMEEFFES